MVGKTVVVTGASGFIAGSLVKLLLERGYIVRGTVRNPDDLTKVEFLWDLPGAKERLKLYKAQLLEQGGFDSAIEGADGVFHVASPVIAAPENPEKDLVESALKGTLNVLRSAAKYETVKRVVLTSSNAAVSFGSRSLAGAIIDESWWSDEELCKKKQEWYMVSKTVAEKAAWEFAKEKKMDMVVINPCMVVGTMLQPSVNLNCELILNFLKGKWKTIPNHITGYVHVEDVAMAHVFAYERPDAEGRYLMAERVLHMRTVVEMLRTNYPEYPFTTELAYDPKDEFQMFAISKEKITELGVVFKPIEQQLSDTVKSLKEKGLL